MQLKSIQSKHKPPIHNPIKTQTTNPQFIIQNPLLIDGNAERFEGNPVFSF